MENILKLQRFEAEPTSEYESCISATSICTLEGE
jgi:hypothetical protein